MIPLTLKFVGAFLLACCCGGIGWMAACRKKAIWQQIVAFERFLQYLLDAIRFRHLPGNMVLGMASQHEDFAPFCPGHTAAFSQIRPPAYLQHLFGSELRDGLHTMETAPRQTVCDTLEHLCELCRREEFRMQETAGAAQRLYPRVGVCLGVLIAIFLA